jgi:5-methylcytosine-specific restriction protein A
MRSVPEWIGASDDQAIPARVKIRIFDRDAGKCCDCTLPIRGKLRPAYDHIQRYVSETEDLN